MKRAIHNIKEVFLLCAMHVVVWIASCQLFLGFFFSLPKGIDNNLTNKFPVVLFSCHQQHLSNTRCAYPMDSFETNNPLPSGTTIRHNITHSGLQYAKHWLLAAQQWQQLGQDCHQLIWQRRSWALAERDRFANFNDILDVIREAGKKF